MSVLSIHSNNINEAFTVGVMHFGDPNNLIETKVRGERRLEYPTPVATTYANPTERVLFDEVRDCNPFFHLFESLWILAGRADVKWLSQWLPGIAKYSDDDIKFHGAYGARLFPQFNAVVNRLQRDPENTRSVLQIYEWARDAYYTGKDMPCNCMIFLTIRDNRLHMTVCNRSNDLILGAYGANVVQFSMIQEYLCARIGNGVTPGPYVQFSHNTHIYPDHPVVKRVLEEPIGFSDLYEDIVKPFPVVREINAWRRELGSFIAHGTMRSYSEPFFEQVAKPMNMAHLYYRERDFDRAHAVCEQIAATDWRYACQSWINRRIVNARVKK